jgi:hypothetical protein
VASERVERPVRGQLAVAAPTFSAKGGRAAALADERARAATRAAALRRAGRWRPEFYSADHLQLNHYYTGSDVELAAKIGRGPNLEGKRSAYARKVMRTVENIEAHEVEDRVAVDYLARIGQA